MRATCTEPGCSNRAFGRGLCGRHYQQARYHGRLPASRDRTCELCRKPFSARKWNARYCSRSCCDRARYERRSRAPRQSTTCEHCNDVLDGRTDKRFCSTACSQAHRNQAIATKTLAAKRRRPPCRGCTGPVPAERNLRAEYCSEVCKITSRRHETYGLTKAELGVLLAQHERCAICGTGDWGRKGPQVDHCHRTGRVRGVLCVNCNTGLGRFADAPDRLRQAAAYLEAPA